MKFPNPRRMGADGLNPWIDYTRIYKTDVNHHGVHVTIMHGETNDSVIHDLSLGRVRAMTKWASTRLREERSVFDNVELVPTDVQTCGGDTQITLLFD